MIPINYHHLYYFWVAAKTGRIGAASRELRLAQPTLSLQLQQLERSLGRALLVRGPRGVTLTAEGRIAFDYCERIFSQGAELAAALRPGEAAGPAVLRLGVSDSVSRGAVTQVLEHLHKLDAQLRVSILGAPAEDLRERLGQHRLDLVVSQVDFTPQLGVEFTGRLAGSIPLYFVAAPKVAARVSRFPSDLARVPMMLMSLENPARKEVDLFLCRHAVAVSVDVETEDSELIRYLVLRGKGTAALDALTVREDLANGRLRKLHPRGPSIKERVWFINGRHPKPNPSLRRAIESLTDQFTLRV